MTKRVSTWRAAACGASFIALGAIASPAIAALPKPVITGTKQGKPLLYDAALVPDRNGRIELELVGKNLGPEGSHPQNGGGYVHLFVRGVSAGMKTGPWIQCGPDPCFPYGGTSKDGIVLGIRPDFYISEPGSHLQFKLFVTPNASLANDPSEDPTASPWSDIYTLDRAPAGAVWTPPEPPTPYLKALTPNVFTQAPGTPAEWAVNASGEHLCDTMPKLVVDGDAGTAISPQGGCNGAGELRYVLSDRQRQLGWHIVTLAANGKTSNKQSYEVKGMTADANIKVMTVPKVTAPIATPVLRLPPQKTPIVPKPGDIPRPTGN